LQANLANNVFFPLLKNGFYMHQVTEDFIIQTFLKDGDCVIDVGANIGYFSLVCAQCIGDGVVYAFEPSAVKFSYVVQMAAQVRQIKHYQLAISNSSVSVRFIDEASSDTSHIAGSQDKHDYLVECCTIDDWTTAHKIERIDFIKVDAEGHDVRVMEGTDEVIKCHQPIIEFEAFTQNDVAQIDSILQCIDKSAGYKIFRVCNQYLLSLKSSVIETNNYFAIPDRRQPDIPDFLLRRGYLALILLRDNLCKYSS
jgi:FkbM family methyltransferase